MDQPRRPSTGARAVFWVGIAVLIPIAFLLGKGGNAAYNRIVGVLLIFSAVASVAGTLFRFFGRRWTLAIMDASEVQASFRPMTYGALFWCLFAPLLYWLLRT